MTHAVGRRFLPALALVCAAAGSEFHSAAAQESAGADQAGGAQALAKKLANPVSDLVSIPFQFNWENGTGSDDGLRTVLNVQPVVPFSVTGGVNLIGRWILPYVSQPASLGSSSGFADVTFSAFLSPARPSSFIWGVGPVFVLPMTSDPTLGTGKWSAGPTVVGLKIQGPWVYGLLANQVWSFAGTSNTERADVNQGFFQPFLSYCTPGGVTWALQSESVANWLAPDAGDIWTVPVNLLVSKLTKFGPFPFSVQAGGGVYVAGPEGAPEWKLRANFVLLLPRK